MAYIIKSSVYREIYNSLITPNQINRLVKIYNYPYELLLLIYTSRTIRSTKSRMKQMRKQAATLYQDWLKGKSIIEIADTLRFPAVILGGIILEQHGVEKGTYRQYLIHPERITDTRIKHELQSAIEHDKVYSPIAQRAQYKRGKFVESAVRDWLLKLNLKFKMEAELRRNSSSGSGGSNQSGGRESIAAGSSSHKKTPDFLLEQPIYYRGAEINWIETKAYFGDKYEIIQRAQVQFLPYVKLFGAGAVIYWYGLVDSVPIIDKVVIETAELLNTKLELDDLLPFQDDGGGDTTTIIGNNSIYR